MDRESESELERESKGNLYTCFLKKGNNLKKGNFFCFSTSCKLIQNYISFFKKCTSLFWNNNKLFLHRQT